MCIGIGPGSQQKIDERFLAVLQGDMKWTDLFISIV